MEIAPVIYGIFYKRIRNYSGITLWWPAAALKKTGNFVAGTPTSRQGGGRPPAPPPEELPKS